MSASKDPLKKNGCLRLKNDQWPSYLFQFNLIKFFASWNQGVLIPINSARQESFNAIVKEMDRVDLDLIPKEMFKAVEDLYFLITDLNKAEGRDYTNYYVFYALTKKRLALLPSEEAAKYTIRQKPVFFSKFEQRTTILRNSFSKIESEDGFELINFYGSLFLFDPAKKERLYYTKEKAGETLDADDWSSAVNNWFNPKGVKSEIQPIAQSSLSTPELIEIYRLSKQRYQKEIEKLPTGDIKTTKGKDRRLGGIHLKSRVKKAAQSSNDEKNSIGAIMKAKMAS